MQAPETLTAEQVQEVIDSAPEFHGRIALSYEAGSSRTSKGINVPTLVCMAFVSAIEAKVRAALASAPAAEPTRAGGAKLVQQWEDGTALLDLPKWADDAAFVLRAFGKLPTQDSHPQAQVVESCKACDGAGFVYGQLYDPPHECQACLSDGPPESGSFDAWYYEHGFKSGDRDGWRGVARAAWQAARQNEVSISIRVDAREAIAAIEAQLAAAKKQGDAHG